MKNSIGYYISTGVKCGLGAAVTFVTLKYAERALDKAIGKVIEYGTRTFIESDNIEVVSEEEKNESGE